MPGLEIRIDPTGFDRLGNMLRAAGPKARVGIARAINHTGDKTRTAMVRALVPQTGLKRGVVVRALKVNRAAQQGGLTYTIKSRGGNIRLRFFGARETRKGVSAAPWNARRVYPGTFMKGGRFPNRVALGRGVLRRAGASRLPLTQVRSGLFIPTEMVTNASAAAFHQVVHRDLPGRLAHELARILG